MRAFLKRHALLHLWLLIVLGLLAFFYLGRGCAPLMLALDRGVTEPLKQLLGTLCAAVPFSVAEVLIVTAVGGGTLYLAALAGDVLRRKQGRWALLYRRLLGFLCAALSVAAAFCLLWGVNYTVPGFQDQSGIRAREVSAEELRQVTELFAEKLNDRAGNVPRTDGFFSAPREEIFAAAPEIYGTVEEEWPFLARKDHRPKPIVLSRLMSETNFTGFFFPLTGEANLNNESPACLLPSTIAHELAHQRGIASEQECNFISVLVCESSGNAVYEYSGALLAYIHLSNALYRADRQAWEEIRASLPEEVRKDLAYNNAYWAQFEGKTAEVSQKTYDRFLKNYGEERGIRSYGEVVDLLVVYYGPAADHS